MQQENRFPDRAHRFALAILSRVAARKIASRMNVLEATTYLTRCLIHLVGAKNFENIAAQAMREVRDDIVREGAARPVPNDLAVRPWRD